MEETPQDRFKKIREEQNLTQKEFAEQLKLNQTYISAIETGRRGISAKLARKLFELYGVSSEWILNGIGEKITKSSSTKYDNTPPLNEKSLGENRYDKMSNEWGEKGYDKMLNKEEESRNEKVFKKWNDAYIEEPGLSLEEERELNRLLEIKYKKLHRYFHKFYRETHKKRPDLWGLMDASAVLEGSINLLEYIHNSYFYEVSGEKELENKEGSSEESLKELYNSIPKDYEEYKQKQTTILEEALKHKEGLYQLIKGVNDAIINFVPYDVKGVVDKERYEEFDEDDVESK